MKGSKPLIKLLQARSLSERESYDLFFDLFNQKLSFEQAKTVLLLLSQKGESAEEVLGCLKALRELEPPLRSNHSRLLDTCGTGGDGSHSINVSTLAALVIAGAGGKIAKHGNRGLSSQCGSSDLLEALGVKLDAPFTQMIQALDQHGIGYFHAPFYHPVFARIQPLRKAIKTRTIFNLLGPLSNPLQPDFQLIGVCRPQTFHLYVKILQKLNATALVCLSADGLDEISLSAPTELAIIQKGKLRMGMLKPQKFGFKPASHQKIRGGKAKKNALIAKKILQNKLKGPARDIVILNAAAGLLLIEKASSFSEALKIAQTSLESGKALKALEGLIQISNAKPKRIPTRGAEPFGKGEGSK